MSRAPKPLAADTSLEAEAMMLAHYRSLDVPEKLAIVFALSRRADDAARVGILERYPDASEHEQALRLASLKYGRDLMVEAFGWDPEVEGW
ncbi:MAG: hypothetical protein GY711_31730 [bacterium]|nr:hypothetical protein [bacterium]